MMLTNYHCHTEFCDGKASAAAMAASAYESGFKVLGFSAHAPLPFITGWTMDEPKLPAYLAEIKRLKAEYEGRMEVLLGFEMDWLPGVRIPGDKFWQGVERDFAIGSVHYLKSPEGELFTVDDTANLLASFIGRHYHGDAKYVVCQYYQTLRDLIAHGGFDILGHFDLIRKNNRELKMFIYEDKWYRDQVNQTIEALAQNPVVVEINTGGMARGKTTTPYPEVWMLKAMKEKNIPICLCSDAHDIPHLLGHQQDGIQAALDAGYRELHYLSQGSWKTTPLD